MTSYLRDANGNPITTARRIYDGANKDYTIGANAFSENTWDQMHWMNAVSLKGTPSSELDWGRVGHLVPHWA